MRMGKYGFVMLITSPSADANTEGVRDRPSPHPQSDWRRAR